MQKLKKYLLAGFMVLALAGFVNFANAQTTTETAKCNKFATYLGPLADGLPRFCSITEILAWGINKMLVLAGTVSVIFLILGGFFYLTAAGNEEQSEKGRKILTNSVIGLVVVVMASAMVRITVNILKSSNTNSTDNTNQSSNNGVGSAGGNSGNSGSASSQSGLSVEQLQQVSSMVNISQINNKVTVSMVTRSSLDPLLRTLCSISVGDDLTGVSMTVYSDGEQIADAVSLQRNGGISYSATVLVPFSSLSSGSQLVSVDICGTEVAGREVLVPQAVGE